MATASKIYLTVNDTGLVKYKPQTPETAKRTAELLQENHEKHHTYFNNRGFHNHIVHGILTLYGLGAPISVIETHYKNNATYQRPLNLNSSSPLPQPDFKNPETFKEFLGNEKYYASFLRFFKSEIEEHGWEGVVEDYVFKENDGEREGRLFGRMFETFYHPLIHLGFAIEFHQPALIAEALAQACVHPSRTGDYLFSVDRAQTSQVSSSNESQKNEPSKTIKEILALIHADKTLSKAARPTDRDPIFEGVLGRARGYMISYAKLYQASPNNLPTQIETMIQSSIYISSLPPNPPTKGTRIDFLLLHSATASLFFPTVLSLPFITPTIAARLLNYKVWLDLALYACRGVPELVSGESYIPKSWVGSGEGEGKEDEWNGIFERLFKFQDRGDDGHAVKLGRSIRYAEILASQPSSTEGMDGVNGHGQKGEVFLKDDMWLRFGHRVVDIVEEHGMGAWVTPDVRI